MLFINNSRLCQPESWQEENCSQLWMRKYKAGTLYRETEKLGHSEKNNSGRLCPPPPEGQEGTMWWEMVTGRGAAGSDHRSCQQRSPSRETWGPNAPPSLSTHPRISREPPSVGSRTEGRRQGSLGDPAPKSSHGGAGDERGWSVALGDRGGHKGRTHSRSQSLHRYPHGCPLKALHRLSLDLGPECAMSTVLMSRMAERESATLSPLQLHWFPRDQL